MRAARPIHGKGRMARIQSAKDGMKVLLHMLLADPAGRYDAPAR
jgi:hypothetical protein